MVDGPVHSRQPLLSAPSDDVTPRLLPAAPHIVCSKSVHYTQRNLLLGRTLRYVILSKNEGLLVSHPCGLLCRLLAQTSAFADLSSIQYYGLTFDHILVTEEDCNHLSLLINLRLTLRRT